MIAWLTRRWDDAPLRVKGIVVIGIPLMPLVVTGALFLLGARNAGTANDWMGRANRTETQIATVLRLVVDADTAVSDFLLTHDREALKPFDAADAALPPALAQLRALVGQPEQINHARDRGIDPAASAAAARRRRHAESGHARAAATLPRAARPSPRCAASWVRWTPRRTT